MRHTSFAGRVLLLGACAASALAQAETPAQPPAPAPATAAPVTLPASTVPDSPPLTLVFSKWTAQLYGFVELDSIYDSTQSFNDIAGNTMIALPKTPAGDDSRLQFGVRNSRLGFRLAAPEYHGIRASALIETDFEGTELPIGNPTPSVPGYGTEAAYFNNPTLRVRHAYVKLEDPFIDFLAGQSWELFGWQTLAHPNSVDIQGLPGQVYSRTPQIRLSHTFRTAPIDVEIAAAALRPVQRDSSVPDVQAGLRMAFNGWRGVHTVGATSTTEDALGIGISGLYRSFNVLDFSAKPSGTTHTNGWGVSLDAMIPLIPATNSHRANALTLTGSWVDGSGIADQYTSLTGGIGFPSLPSGTYSPDIDNGYVTWNRSGQLEAIEWTSWMVGLQYYLPPWGNVWVSANFSDLRSPNAQAAVQPANEPKIVDTIQWADANLFWDITPAVRVGAEYAWFSQLYGDNREAHDNRAQFSAYYLF